MNRNEYVTAAVLVLVIALWISAGSVLGMGGPVILGLVVLEVLKSEHSFLEVIILTGHGSLDSAVECTKLGAFGYLPKPYEFDRLIEVLKDAYQHRLHSKFKNDQDRMEVLMAAAVGESPLGILRRLSQLDDEEK